MLGLRKSRELEDCVRSRNVIGVGWGGGWGVILAFTFWLSLTCLIKEPLSSLKVVVVVDRFYIALFSALEQTTRPMCPEAETVTAIRFWCCSVQGLFRIFFSFFLWFMLWLRRLRVVGNGFSIFKLCCAVQGFGLFGFTFMVAFCVLN